MIIISGKCEQGLNPFGIAQECGNCDTQNSELDLDRNCQEEIDVLGDGR